MSSSRAAALPAITALLLAAACTAASGAQAPGTAGVGSTLALPAAGPAAPLSATLLAVVDPDTAAALPPAGDRYVSVEFRVTDESRAAAPENLYLAVTLVDATGRTFPAVPVTTVAGPQLAAHADIVPGAVATGWVTFDIPTPDAVTAVQARNGGTGAAAVWAIG